MTSAMSANPGSPDPGRANHERANRGPADSGPANPGPVGGGLGGLGGLVPAGRLLGNGRLVMTPARRAAILIGVPVVFLIFIANGYSAVSNVAQGSFPVSEAVPLPDGQLTVNLGGGNATLAGSDALSATARVAGTVSYHLARPSLRTTPGNLSINCPATDEGNCSLSGKIDVPTGTALTLRTGGGDLTASNLSDGGTLGSDGGNITLSDARGDLALNSGGGDVQASHVSGQVITISADGGNVTGSAIAAARLTASSGGGDVELRLTSSPVSLQVSSDGGDVTIVVPNGKYIVSTNSNGGSVSSTIPDTPGATNMISVSSGGGDISISE